MCYNFCGDFMGKIFNDIIKEICLEKNIKLSLLSRDWVMKLDKDGKSRYIAGYKFDLNTHSLGLIFDDKFGTYDLLDSYNIPIIKHNIFYSSSNKNDYAVNYNSLEYLEMLFKEYNNDIVLKYNSGSLGNGVYHINNHDLLVDIYNKFSNKSSSFSICPFYNIDYEFRTIILNGEIKLIYKKIRPVVIGDGKKTIRELLIDFNKDYFSNYNGDGLDRVLDIDEKYEEFWQFNLSQGVISSLDVSDSDKDSIINIISSICNVISIGFGSVDIIKTNDGKFLVMEINSGVMMEGFVRQHDNGYDIAKNIFSDAVDAMFNE